MNPADLVTHASLVWLMATGLVLGALHALEPGHAKTLIASFVVATRGSVKQAVLLGVSSAVSHSLLVWILAGLALWFGDRYIGDDAEPWLQLISGFAIVAIGATMLWRLTAPHRADARARRHAHDHAHAHGHDHGHDHGHGHDHYHGHDHGHDHDHDHDHAHDHTHDHGHAHGHEDAHAVFHARQIERRFDGRTVTTRQVALFGLSSGLMPCPAALTMLLVCLHLKRVVLGFGLVASFSVGLAVTLVALGVVASLGVRHASRHLPQFDRWSAILPYASAALVVIVGLVMGISGYERLA